MVGQIVMKFGTIMHFKNPRWQTATILKNQLIASSGSRDGGGGHWLVWMEPSRIDCLSASVNLSLHHKVQKFSSGTSSPGWSRKKGHKTVVVVVAPAMVQWIAMKFGVMTLFLFLNLTTETNQFLKTKMANGWCPDVCGWYTQRDSAGNRTSMVQMPVGLHIGATCWILLNRPCAAAMRPLNVKLLWPLVIFLQQFEIIVVLIHGLYDLGGSKFRSWPWWAIP